MPFNRVVFRSPCHPYTRIPHHNILEKYGVQIMMDRLGELNYGPSVDRDWETIKWHTNLLY